MSNHDWYILGQAVAAKADNVHNAYEVSAALGDDLCHDLYLCYDMAAELLFFNAGLYGKSEPVVATGWRYGNVPACGFSYNFRDDYPEAGVSVMAIDNGDETQDKISCGFIALEGRPVIKVKGYLHYETGSDGEPLLVNAIEI